MIGIKVIRKFGNSIQKQKWKFSVEKLGLGLGTWAWKGDMDCHLRRRDNQEEVRGNFAVHKNLDLA